MRSQRDGCRSGASKQCGDNFSFYEGRGGGDMKMVVPAIGGVWNVVYR